MAVEESPSSDEDNDGDKKPHHNHHHHHRKSPEGHDDSSTSSSSSDENDSTAAAHAAAIGHSPQPNRASGDKPAAGLAAIVSAVPDPLLIKQTDQKAEADSAAAVEKGQSMEAAADTAAIVAQGQEKGLASKSEPASGQSNDPTHTQDVKEETVEEKTEIMVESPEKAKTAEKDPEAPDDMEIDKADMEIDGDDKNNDTRNEKSNDTGKDKNNDTEKEKSPPQPKNSEGTAKRDAEAPTEKSNGDSKSHPPATAVNHDAKGQPPKNNVTGGGKHRRSVRTQVNRSINVNERDDDENTALHVAIHARKLEHVKLLLEAGASCRMKCDGSWPLHTAISMGALKQHKQFAYECVVALREAGADLMAKDDSMHTPLFLTCMFNLPQITSYILSDEEGESTLNVRADRAGNRPLHAAAKYDTPVTAVFSKSASASVTGQVPNHHHPDGSVVTAMHPIPSFPGKLEKVHTEAAVAAAAGASPRTQSTEALLTQLLLGTSGIEIDALNVMGQTPLHVACLRGNWPVVRLLIDAGADTSIVDRRGYTPGQLAYKRGLFLPVDLIELVGDPPESGVVPPPRDLIVDPDGPTLLLCHELCILHRTCPPIRRDSPEPPPENVRRLTVLVDEETGILRSGEFGNLVWKDRARRVAISDVLKVHDYGYVESISQMASTIPDHPNAIAHLDPDTAISHWSFEAAMRAAGSVCEAVDKVVAGECRNVFCAVRPPGHHAGPRGIVRCANDPEGGSHGFCLLNNVAIGAAYARSMYRNEGIRKVAIIDFDVHHGKQ